MRNQKEIYQALLAGKTLISGLTKIKLKDGYIFNIGSKCHIPYYFSHPQDWEIYDEYYELKKAHSEGALIESINRSSDKPRWTVESNPHWFPELEYRIKGGISFEAWSMFKDEIMAYWAGKEIEFKILYAGEEWKSSNAPTWEDTGWFDYRVKPEPVYEWQWIGKPTATSDSFSITAKYYAEGEFVPELYYFIERYEPSKRERV